MTERWIKSNLKVPAENKWCALMPKYLAERVWMSPTLCENWWEWQRSRSQSDINNFWQWQSIRSSLTLRYRLKITGVPWCPSILPSVSGCPQPFVNNLVGMTERKIRTRCEQFLRMTEHQIKSSLRAPAENNWCALVPEYLAERVWMSPPLCEEFGENDSAVNHNPM